MLDSKCALGRTSDFQDTFALLSPKAIFTILESYNDDDDRSKANNGRGGPVEALMVGRGKIEPDTRLNL